MFLVFTSALDPGNVRRRPDYHSSHMGLANVSAPGSKPHNYIFKTSEN